MNFNFSLRRSILTTPALEGVEASHDRDITPSMVVHVKHVWRLEFSRQLCWASSRRKGLEAPRLEADLKVVSREPIRIVVVALEVVLCNHCQNSLADGSQLY